MWWMVNETANVDNNPISSFLESYPEDDSHWNAVRIKVTSGDNIIYLDNYILCQMKSVFYFISLIKRVLDFLLI